MKRISVLAGALTVLGLLSPAVVHAGEKFEVIDLIHFADSGVESAVESTAELCAESTTEPMVESCIESAVESMAELCAESNVESVPEQNVGDVEELANQSESIIHLGFAGDINFDESWPTTQYMDQQPNGILDAISPNLIELTNGFDLFMINNEFTYSTGGSRITDKTYHFRADPTRVENLKTLGADLVLLANNHVFDYGEEALEDTFSVLDSAGIPYVGAGRDLREASTPYYVEFNGRTIAFTAASQAEMYDYRGVIATRAAAEDQSGVMACYDPTAYLEEIRKADAEADFVIASIHWGMEYEPRYYDSQHDLAVKMIEAGADAVIGTHPHCLQGVEFIEGKPVFYSLGNYWFNEKTLNTGVAELTLTIPDDIEKAIQLKETRFYPAIQCGLTTVMPEEGEQRRAIFADLQQLSAGKISISDTGVITEQR